MLISAIDRRHRRPGFSLPEMLVVVGIIVVLLAILLPTLRSVRDQGRMTSSMSNLRQIGQWMTLYADDNRQHIVPSQFDYSENLYSGKVRSEDSPPMGDEHIGSWADILWTLHKPASIPQAALPAPDGLGYSYEFDAPDQPLYELLSDDIANPFRSVVANTRDAYGTAAEGAAGGPLNVYGAMPYGEGAAEKGLPGFFAANDFFNARPDAPDVPPPGSTVAVPPPPSGRWFTTAQIRIPAESMYLIDSFAGEVIGMPDNFLLAFDFSDPVVEARTGHVDFRYSGVALALLLDGHVEPVSEFENLDELETKQRIRVRDLDR